MNLTALIVVASIVLVAAGLAALASLAMDQVEDEWCSFSGFGGMHFES